MCESFTNKNGHTYELKSEHKSAVVSSQMWVHVRSPQSTRLVPVAGPNRHQQERHGTESCLRRPQGVISPATPPLPCLQTPHMSLALSTVMLGKQIHARVRSSGRSEDLRAQ